MNYEGSREVRSNCKNNFLIAAAITALLSGGVPLLACAASPGPAPEGGQKTPDQGTVPQSDVSTAATATNSPPVFEDYAIHGQTTFVDQFHPGFHSAYRGPNSLDPGRRGNETWDVTLYAGFRPRQGAEVWINPELDRGFGLNNTLGIAGYPSAEAYKVGAAAPYLRIPKQFLRQTLNLSGEVQGIAPDLNQLGGSQTANRLIFTAGKFEVVDVFDTNKYAHDPRNDFLNWAVVDAAAFD
jgi:high affinity Mn2+ porin